VLYVLSVGPAVRAVRANLISGDTAEAIYAPLVWLHSETPLREPLEWYTDLWGGR
jgi:hypothetical protein